MKDTNYYDYDLTDFLVDEEFRRWVLDPDKNRSFFWNRWLLNYPEKRSMVLKAREIILSMDFPVSSISEGDKNNILDLILRGAPSRTKESVKLVELNPGETNISWYKIAIAASVLILFSVIAAYMVNEQFVSNQNIAHAGPQHRMIVKESSLGQKITTRLPDGTMVTLNSGSQISYPEKFVGDSRNVTLKGEAFFNVKHNPEKPFYVDVNGDEVRVLGTSFNIRFYPEDNFVDVSVASGKVSYRILSGQKVILEPNRKAVHNLTKDVLTTSEVDPLQSFGWKDKIIYFNSTKLEDILIELERWYGVDIEVNKNFYSNETFTGKFEDLSLKEVLTGLSYEFRFQFQTNEKGITIIQSQNRNINYDD